MMKRSLFVLCFALFISSILGCASLKQVGKGKERLSKEGPLYSGPKAKLALTELEIKSPKATSEIGSSLRDMLMEALKKSNRFLIVAPQASASSTAEGPDLIITIVLTEFEPQISGGSAGMGGGGGASSGILGGLLGTALNKAHLALDIRIVDTATSEVLSSTLVQGQASEGMENAMRICIFEAARYISQAIPANYYKH